MSIIVIETPDDLHSKSGDIDVFLQMTRIVTAIAQPNGISLSIRVLDESSPAGSRHSSYQIVSFNFGSKDYAIAEAVASFIRKSELDQAYVDSGFDRWGNFSFRLNLHVLTVLSARDNLFERVLGKVEREPKVLRRPPSKPIDRGAPECS